MSKNMVKMHEGNLIRNNSSCSIGTSQGEYIKKATAANTRRAYQAAIRQFELNGRILPACEQSIAEYITDKAAILNPRTLSLHLTALSHWHDYQQLPDPTQTPYIRKLLKGVKHTHGRPKRKAQALYPEHIQQMVAQLNQKDTLKSIRDNALIQVAYFGAFRRSELIAMRVEDMKFNTKGLMILIPRSKSDQEGTGKVKALPYGKGDICPVTSIKKWLDAANLTEGHVFRSISRWGKMQSSSLHPDSINSILKKLASECSFDFIDELSSHSLRRGFATSAASAGAKFDSIKRQGGWSSDNTVKEYIDDSKIFDENAAISLIDVFFNNST